MDLNLRGTSEGPAYLPTVATPIASSSHFEDEADVTQAVIIAAGNGSRLQGYRNNCPKPLIKVAGVPLLKRVILAAKRAGVKEFVIVLGYQAARIRKSINASKLGVKITWVRNVDWRKPNGLSVLKAEKFVRGRFYLFMADHVFDPKILERLKKSPLDKECGTLCVDYRLNRIPNLDDATKVRTKHGRLYDLGKSLTDFNAIDVGIFVCTPELFDALRVSHERNEYALSDGVRVLAREGKMRTFDIGEAYWQDVDTVPDVRLAERLLLRATRSSGDGIIAKLINRRISNPISRLLARTPVTPNQISFFNLLFSAFVAWLVSLGQPLTTALGGVLFQLVSILDGCDGEIAHIKLQDSKKGAFIDTLTDQLSYILFIIGVTLGAFHATQSQVVFYVTGAILVGLLIALNFGRLYVKRRGSASLRELDKGIASLNHDKQKAWYLRLFGSFHHFGRRDMFSFIAMILMLFGNIVFFYWLLMVVLVVISLGISLSSLAMLRKENTSTPLRRLFQRMFSRAAVPATLELETEK